MKEAKNGRTLMKKKPKMAEAKKQRRGRSRVRGPNETSPRLGKVFPDWRPPPDPDPTVEPDQAQVASLDLAGRPRSGWQASEAHHKDEIATNGGRRNKMSKGNHFALAILAIMLAVAPLAAPKVGANAVYCHSYGRHGTIQSTWHHFGKRNIDANDKYYVYSKRNNDANTSSKRNKDDNVSKNTFDSKDVQEVKEASKLDEEANQVARVSSFSSPSEEGSDAKLEMPTDEDDDKETKENIPKTKFHPLNKTVNKSDDNETKTENPKPTEIKSGSVDENEEDLQAKYRLASSSQIIEDENNNHKVENEAAKQKVERDATGGNDEENYQRDSQEDHTDDRDVRTPKTKNKNQNKVPPEDDNQDDDDTEIKDDIKISKRKHKWKHKFKPAMDEMTKNDQEGDQSDDQEDDQDNDDEDEEDDEEPSAE
jgi:hypothetical protein